MFAVHQECRAQAWVSHGEQVRLVAGTMEGMCGPGVRGWGRVGTRWERLLELSDLGIRNPRSS